MEDAEKTRFTYRFGKFTLDPMEKTLFSDGKPLHLPAKEFETLLLLVENNGKALSKEHMIKAIWQDAFVEEGNLAKQISRLRKLFNANGTNLIETIPKHGYRFSAEINQIIIPTEETILEKHTIKKLTVEVEEDFAEAHLSLNGTKNRFLNPTSLALIGLLILTTGLIIWTWNKSNDPAKINSIAVLPLKPLTAEESNKALGLGLADALITKIGSLRMLTVRPTSAVVKFADVDTDVLEIGKKLNVDAVLEGTIQQSEGRIRINARLLKTSSGEQIWAEKYDQPASEIFALQDALSNKIAKTLAFEINKSEFFELATRPTENAEAFEKYLRGRFYQSQNNEQGLTRSIELYEQAIALDSNFAEPYGGVADAYLILYNFGLRSSEQVVPQIKKFLNQALRLNPNISQVHLTEAQLAFLYEKDFAKAERSYQKAVELNPNNADAFLRYGYFLTFLGRFDDALVKLEKSVELNPISSFAQMDIALVYLCQRKYPAAINQLNKTVAENPDFSIPQWLLGASFEADNEPEKAFTANLRALELEGGSELAKRLNNIKQAEGEKAAYQKWLDETLELRKKEFVPAIQIAMFAAILKNREQTLEWLEKAEQEHEATLWQIKYIARFDFLREDERFKKLLEKLDSAQK